MKAWLRRLFVHEECTKFHWACITCGRSRKHHNMACICQDFRMVCVRCGMRKQ